MEPAVSITKFLTEYGPWGMLALALVALRWMFGKYEASQQARIDDGKLYASALKDTAVVLAKMQDVQTDQSAEMREIKMQVENRRVR